MIAFLLDRHMLARAALDRSRPVPAGESSMSRVHIRMLPVRAQVDVEDMDRLPLQLTAALEGPVLLYLSMDGPVDTAPLARRLSDSWRILVDRLVPMGE
ncbi:MAG: hypothetical protein JF597_44020 [Streptomyces sp.]|uniref:hypothetical protein n=1 Tax=Streptomyces sp. TaxID=1931 RepID=UPI0025E92B5A|nr:hypothetical protein [Streptomyces sp.]MBW8800295.1 hypothetical protein [Streptomyces sp.]